MRVLREVATLLLRKKCNFLKQVSQRCFSCKLRHASFEMFVNRMVCTALILCLPLLSFDETNKPTGINLSCLVSLTVKIHQPSLPPPPLSLSLSLSLMCGGVGAG